MSQIRFESRELQADRNRTLGAPAAVFIGVVSSVMSNILTSLKGWFRFDDAMDIYACHGVAGIVGLVFTGVFAQASVTANDGFTVVPGGWLDGNYRQVGVQLAYICAVWGYVFFVSYLLMFLIDHIPGCHFRASEEGEIIGIDESDLGEYCYGEFSFRAEIELKLILILLDWENLEGKRNDSRLDAHSLNTDSEGSVEKVSPKLDEVVVLEKVTV